MLVLRQNSGILAVTGQVEGASIKQENKAMFEAIGDLIEVVGDWAWYRITYWKRRKYAELVRKRLGVE